MRPLRTPRSVVNHVLVLSILLLLFLITDAYNNRLYRAKTAFLSNTWTTNWPAEGGAVQSLRVDPSNSDIIYAGTTLGKVYKSTDGGLHWNSASNGLQNTTVYSLTTDPANSSIVYAGADALYKSTDGGLNWSAVNSGLPNSVLALAIDPASPSTIYAISGSYFSAFTYFGDIYKTTNGGANWQAVYVGTSATSQVSSLALDPLAPGTIYAGSYDNILRSNDTVQVGAY